MLEALNPQPQDKILALIALYRDDPRTDKIDLGVGVYKDATGLTPVMRAVKAAEQKIWETQTTKTYTALAGEPEYRDAMTSLVLGDLGKGRVASVGTVGGTGAIRQALELGKWGAACQPPRFVQVLGRCGWQLALGAALDDFAGLGVVLDAVRCGGQPKLGVYGCAQRRARRLKLIIWRHSSQSQSVVYFGQHQPLNVVLAPWSGFAICPPVNEGLTAPRLYGILVVHKDDTPLVMCY